MKEAVAGNMRLPEAMASRLRRRVALGEPVMSINTLSSGVQATLASGQTVEADAAILALPIPALRQIILDLPPSQLAVLDDVDYHKIVQLHCVVDEPFWEAAGWGGSWWTDGLLGRIFHPTHTRLQSLQHDYMDQW